MISTFLNRTLAGEPIEIWGDGSVVRDYLHVTDLAELCVSALGGDRTGAYNAGSGVGTSLNTIIDTIGTVTGTPLDPVFKPGRAIDVQRSVLDVARAAADFGWSCKVPLRDGIADTHAWLRRTRSGTAA